MADVSPVVMNGIPALAVGMGALFAAGYAETSSPKAKATSSVWWRFLLVSLCVLGWMVLTAVPACAGWLTQFDRFPPRAMLLFLLSCVMAVALGLSPVGKQFALGLPLAALVGAQAFRLPLELVMHVAARDGIMPPQMSYTGCNFDIVSGAGAAVVAFLFAKKLVSLRWVWIWNIIGILLLLTIILIAAASMPLIHAFGTEPVLLNTWIAYFPFVWLPGVLVPSAIFGHIVITRRLLAEARGLTAR